MSGNSATDFSVSTSPISPEIRLFSQSQSRPIAAMTRSTLMPSSRMRSSTASRTLLSYSARGSTPGGVVRNVVQQWQRVRYSP